jgi:16S rRNA (cytosine967-C5)-methyltransferase
MSVWTATCRLLAKHLATGERLDQLLETLPRQLSAEERRRARHLLYGTVRHFQRLDGLVLRHVVRTPRPGLRAVLAMGAFELSEHPEEAAQIVHHWVGVARECTSAGEARLVNAVLRKLPATLAEEAAQEPNGIDELARRFSHPTWLVRRWMDAFGGDAVRRLLEWNQTPAPVHARVSGGRPTGTALPDYFVPTPWAGFFRLERLDWAQVEAMLGRGEIYLQDPATSLAPGLLDARAGENVLDLCAAPGGKAFQLAERVDPAGRVIAVDLPGPRLERLRRNAGARASLPVTVFAADVCGLAPERFADAGLPTTFDAALLDAPCSNTGVLRHRVDVKRRLKPDDLVGLSRLQSEMIRAAARVVRPGGRLVYSTCSLEAEENEGVVQAFLEGAGGEWALERAVHARPWIDACDGAGAFLLRRSG